MSTKKEAAENNSRLSNFGKGTKTFFGVLRNYAFVALIAALGGTYFGYHYSQTEQVKFQQAVKALAPAASAQAVPTMSK